MRQLSLFEAAPTPDVPASSWANKVPASPSDSSNRYWTLLCKRSEPSITLLAVLSVQWNNARTGNAVIFVPYTGSTITGPDFLTDVFRPFHAEVAAIARLHGVGEHRAVSTCAWRGETRSMVQGPFRGQEGLGRAS